MYLQDPFTMKRTKQRKLFYGQEQLKYVQVNINCLRKDKIYDLQSCSIMEEY